MKENKILSFKSSEGSYVADACIIWCFDDRFSGLLEIFIKDRGYKNYDLVKIAGGAKTLADPENEIERLFLLKQIRISINSHQAKQIVLMCHEDCCAYGAREGIKNVEEEHNRLIKDLKEAVHILKNNLPEDVEIEAMLADFEGIEEIK